MNEESPIVWSPESLTQTVKEHPYIAMGIAAAAGYVLAGGLPTPFTRRIVRIGMRAIFVPLAASQLKALTAPADLLADES